MDYQTLEVRYRKKLDKQGMELLESLLAMNEKERPTAEKALMSPFFVDLLKVDTEFQEELSRSVVVPNVKALCNSVVGKAHNQPKEQREELRKEAEDKENHNTRNKQVDKENRKS